MIIPGLRRAGALGRPYSLARAGVGKRIEDRRDTTTIGMQWSGAQSSGNNLVPLGTAIDAQWADSDAGRF